MHPSEERKLPKITNFRIDKYWIKQENKGPDKCITEAIRLSGHAACSLLNPKIRTKETYKTLPDLRNPTEVKLVTKHATATTHAQFLSLSSISFFPAITYIELI